MKNHTDCEKENVHGNIKLQNLLKYRNLVSWILFSMLLLIGAYFMFQDYYNNNLKILDDSYFRNTGTNSQSLIVPARLRDYDQGIIPFWWKLYREDDQYGAQPFIRNKPYPSSLGFQGMLSGIIYKYFTSKTDSDIRRIENCRKILLGITIALLFILLTWIHHEFGLLTAIISYGALLYSPWLVLLSRDFYWFPGSLLLPFCVCVAVFWNRNELSWKQIVVSCSCLYAAMLIRFACGFEFLSCVCISTLVPITYYALKYSWSWLRYGIHIFTVAAIGLFAFATAVILNIIQNMYIFKISFSNAFSSFLINMMYRTTIGNQAVPEQNFISLLSSLNEVFHTYFFTGTPVVFNLRFISVAFFFCFSFLTFLVVYLRRNGRLIDSENRKIFALFTAGFIAFLAPVSWLLLAKGHSYDHPFIVFYIFSLPAVPIMLAAPVYFMVEFFRTCIGNFYQSRSRFVLFAGAVISCTAVYFAAAYFNWSGYLVVAKYILAHPDFQCNGFSCKILDGKIWLVVEKSKKVSDCLFMHMYSSNSLPGQDRHIMLSWEKKEIPLPWFFPFRIINHECNTLTYDRITLGQFYWGSDKKKVIIWQTTKPLPKPNIFCPVTDSNWENGILRYGNTLLLRNCSPDYLSSIKGKPFMLPSNRIIVIKSYSFVRFGYIHAHFENAKMPPLIVSNLTDSHWENGILRSGRQVILLNRGDNPVWENIFQHLRNASISLPGEGCFIIKKVILSPLFVHLHLDKGITVSKRLDIIRPELRLH